MRGNFRPEVMVVKLAGDFVLFKAHPVEIEVPAVDEVENAFGTPAAVTGLIGDDRTDGAGMVAAELQDVHLAAGQGRDRSRAEAAALGQVAKDGAQLSEDFGRY